jgi:hypothetical protein
MSRCGRHNSNSSIIKHTRIPHQRCVSGSRHMLWFGLVLLGGAVVFALAAALAGRAPAAPRASTGTLALASTGLALTVIGTRQPRESAFFGALLVLLSFGGLLVAGLGMAVGPSEDWIPGRRGAFAWTVGALVVMTLGFGVVPAAASR